MQICGRIGVLMTTILGLGATCAAAVQSDDALRQQLAELEARLAALEAAQTHNEMDRERHEAIRTLVADVLADAEQRTSLLSHGFRAGHDGSFFVADAQGAFRVQAGGLLQPRYIYNRQRNSPTDNHRSGFELRRVQLDFRGHIIDPRLTFRIQGAFNRSGGVLQLLDGEIGWRFNDQWSIRAGQFRPGFLREDSTSSTRQLAVERSLINSRFGQNRMQGIELRGRVHENIRVSSMISDGLRNRRMTWDQQNVEYALTGRAEWLIAGRWQQFRQFTSPPGESFGAMIGTAIHWQSEEFGTADDGEVRMVRWTVDGQMSLGGVSFFAAYISSHERAHRGASRRPWGLVAQAAVYVAPKWELFTRYEHGSLDQPMPSVRNELSVLTTGFNWYIDGRRLKWTTDIGVGFKPVDPGWASSSAGWRADAPGNRSQIVVRNQLQVVF
jgi:phosphate-selective porin OprO and OprP